MAFLARYPLGRQLPHVVTQKQADFNLFRRVSWLHINPVLASVSLGLVEVLYERCGRAGMPENVEAVEAICKVLMGGKSIG